MLSKYTSNSAIYQHFPRISMPSNPPSRYMTTIYHYFLSLLRQNRNKTCPELTKLQLHKNISGEHALEPSLQSWAPAEIFVRGGGASPKRGPYHEVKSSEKALT